MRLKRFLFYFIEDELPRAQKLAQEGVVKDSTFETTASISKILKDKTRPVANKITGEIAGSLQWFSDSQPTLFSWESIQSCSV